MGIPPDEPEVSGGTIQRDVRISNGRALEEIGRTRGPRAQPTGGARPAGAPAIQARGGSQGPIGQVRGSGGGVAAIGGPTRGAQDKRGRAPPGASVVRIRTLHLVRPPRSEEHTSELQSHHDLVCRLLLEKKKKHNSHTERRTYHKEAATITRP